MRVLDRIEINEEKVAEICRRYQVRELALFGSVLRDDFREDSDIDILVEYEPDARVGLYAHFDVAEELAQLLGRKVDLISKRGLNPLIRDEVLAASQPLYAAAWTPLSDRHDQRRRRGDRIHHWPNTRLIRGQ